MAEQARNDLKEEERAKVLTVCLKRLRRLELIELLQGLAKVKELYTAGALNDYGKALDQ